MSNARILLAEDEASLRMLVSDLLQDEGFEVVETSDGAHALNEAENNSFDMAILDYMMPEYSGVEVCERIRGFKGPNQALPIVLLTAKAQQKDRDRAKDAGVTRFVTKPFRPIELIEVVLELLKQREDNV